MTANERYRANLKAHYAKAPANSLAVGQRVRFTRCHKCAGAVGVVDAVTPSGYAVTVVDGDSRYATWDVSGSEVTAY